MDYFSGHGENGLASLDVDTISIGVFLGVESVFSEYFVN